MAKTSASTILRQSPANTTSPSIMLLLLPTRNQNQRTRPDEERERERGGHRLHDFFTLLDNITSAQAQPTTKSLRYKNHLCSNKIDGPDWSSTGARVGG